MLPHPSIIIIIIIIIITITIIKINSKSINKGYSECPRKKMSINIKKAK